VFRARDRIEVKTPDQIELMRAAGLVVAGALDLVREHLVAGVTTATLDELAETYIRDHGGVPSFLGYPYSGENDFPGTICASVNDEIVHGIPGPRVIQDADLVSIDCGAIVAGWHGDAAFTAAVGPVPEDQQELLKATEAALWQGLAAARVGARLSDISHAVELVLRGGGRFGIVEEYVGHGIGTQMHMDPQVPNFGPPGRGPRLVAGMALAVEPMATLGRRYTRVLDDDWTVVTADGSRAAHFEHTVAVTDQGPWVLTAVDGGARRFADLGVAGAATAAGAAGPGFPGPPGVP
jgi:methionyl aminopeptidase